MSEENKIEEENTKKLPVKKRYIFTSLAIIGALAAGYFIYDALGYQSTDDAYVETTTVSVSPKVSGQIVKVLVKDDQPVKAARRAGDDVEMTVCNRVKAAGVNCCSHGASSRLSSAEDRHRSLAVAVIPVTHKTRNFIRKGLLKGSFTDYYTTVRQNVNF